MGMDQMLTDMLTTAVEGGIGYWAATTSYRWDCPVADRHVTLVDANEDMDEGEPEFPETRVDVKMIRGAMNKVAFGRWYEVPEPNWPGAEARRVCARLLRVPDADVDYDSTTADQVMQVAVLGKVVFG